MFLLIDNYDSFTYNLVQAFCKLGREPLVVKNDDPSLLAMASAPELEMVCISPGPGHPSQAGHCLEFMRLLPKSTPRAGRMPRPSGSRPACRLPGSRRA